MEKLGREVRKIKESVHAIQVGCEICDGAHLSKDCPLRDDEDVQVEEVKYGDGRPFQGNNSGYRGQGYNSRFNNRGPIGERRPSLEDTISKFLEDSAKRETDRNLWLKSFQEGTEASLKSHDETLKNLEGKIEVLAQKWEEKLIVEKAKACVAVPLQVNHDQNKMSQSDKELRRSPETQLRRNSFTEGTISPGNEANKVVEHDELKVDTDNSCETFFSNNEQPICTSFKNPSEGVNYLFEWEGGNDLDLNDFEPLIPSIKTTTSVTKEESSGLSVATPRNCLPPSKINQDVEEDPEIPLTLGQPSFTTTTIEDSKFFTDKTGKCSPNETVCAISGIANDTTVTTPVPSLNVFEPEEGGTSSKHTGDSTPTLCIRNKRCSFAKRKHWCEAIPIDNKWSYDLWPSCNPNEDLCDAGGDVERLRGNKHLWSLVLDQFRKNLPYKGTISFDEWILITHGKIDEKRTMEIWEEM